uniref:BTB domain-containing protein n=1 Tax=Timema genevievae TaxID=629358 RepID=A0A7R9K9V2_TIMGE|nr:unnamed protein product [Timema genevievae]
MKMEGQSEPMGVLSIYDLMRNVKWSDVTFVVGRSSEEEETLRAHKLLLAASSPVFEAMLYGSLAESGPVRVTDLKPRTFLALLEYVYTDESNFQEMEDAFETLYAAKKYLLPQLVTRCNEYISSLLRFSNVCFVLEFAMGIHEERLSEKCLLFIGQNAREVLSHSSFLSIKQSTLAVILDQDDLDVKSELEVLDAVLRWSTEELPQEEAIVETLQQEESHRSDVGEGPPVDLDRRTVPGRRRPEGHPDPRRVPGRSVVPRETELLRGPRQRVW